MSGGRNKPSQKELLEGLLKKHKISIRRLARAMSASEDPKDWERARRNLTRWLGQDNGMRDDSAELLVEAFRSLGVILPADYFKKPRPKTWRQEMEERYKAMQAEIRELRRQLGA